MLFSCDVINTSNGIDNGIDAERDWWIQVIGAGISVFPRTMKLLKGAGHYNRPVIGDWRCVAKFEGASRLTFMSPLYSSSSSGSSSTSIEAAWSPGWTTPVQNLWIGCSFLGDETGKSLSDWGKRVGRPRMYTSKLTLLVIPSVLVRRSSGCVQMFFSDYPNARNFMLNPMRISSLGYSNRTGAIVDSLLLW